MAALPARRRVVVFDLGGVLLQWNPRFLYRKLFAGDEAAMERFLDRSVHRGMERAAGRRPQLRGCGGRAPPGAWRQAASHRSVAPALRRDDSRRDRRHRGDRERLEAARRAALRADELVVRDLSVAARALPVSVAGSTGSSYRGTRVSSNPTRASSRSCWNGIASSPEEAVFIDDNPRNAQAASALGIHGIHFRSPEHLRGELDAARALVRMRWR